MAIVEWGALQTVAPSGASSQSILKLPNGTFVVAWQIGSGTTSEVYFQIFSAAGEPLTGATLVPETPDLADNSGPSLVLTDEGFLVLASSPFQGNANDDDVVGVRYDASGGYLGRGEYPGSFADDTNPNAVFTNGNLFTVYDDGDGVTLSREPLQNGTSQTVELDTTGAVNDPDIALSAFGSMMAVWEDGSSIVGQRIAADGSLAGSVFTVAGGDPSFSPYSPNITALKSGGFVVTYNTSSFTGFSSSFVLLDSSGAVVTAGPLGGASIIESISVEIVALNDGGFYALSTYNGSFSDATTIQRYDSSGVKVGEPQAVLMGEGESVRGVELLDDGRLVVLIVDADGATKFQMLDDRDGLVDGDAASNQLYGNDLYNDQIKGRGGIDTLYGLNGNDRLDGGTGGDTLIGGVGDDTYVVDSVADQVIEFANEGIDTVYSSVTFDNSTLPGQSIENITLTGSANINATGYNGRNVLIGNSGSNELNGKGGDDVMTGGLGDDTYIVDRAGDLTVEKAGQGNDTVKAVLSWTLSANIERLILAGTGNFSATGNALDNTIAGNANNNVITGGLGKDTMTGGGGNDTFDFNDVAETNFATPDRITDLNAGDRVDFSTIDANSVLGGNQAFTRVAAFSGAAGQITITFNSGAGITDVRGDVNGDGAADFRLFITGDQTAFTGWVF